MALRDQPYLPLYIKDIMTDEKLIECSAEAHGIYLRLLCILHKQEKYGLLCLKQKYKQTESKILDFARMLVKQMPFSMEVIAKGLEELVSEDVIKIDEDFLYQKRMVKDGEISIMRTEVGKLGGSSVTKQYGVSGFFYLMSDGSTLHKIGISKNPKNRLYRLRSDLKLSKLFDIKESIPVSNMSKVEDEAHVFFGKDLMDGEWVKCSYKDVLKQFALLKAKIEANAEYEYEYESVNESEINKRNSKEYTLKEGGTGETKNGIGLFVNRMHKFWIEQFPHYTIDHGKDTLGLINIYSFIVEQARVEKIGDPEDREMIFDTFKLVANHIKTDGSWWQDKSLQTISGKMQDFYNAIKLNKNGNGKFSTNGKSAKSTKPTTDDLQEAHYRRYPEQRPN
jgi:hypothetical protein